MSGTKRNGTGLSGTRCKVCNHPDRARFDREMITGTLRQAEVAHLVGCGKATVSRHVKNHLIPAAQAMVKADPTLQVDILGEVRTLINTMKQHALAASEEGINWQAIRAYHAELRAELELLAKLLLVIAPASEDQYVNTRGWVELRSLILTSLAPYPEALGALVLSLDEADA